jgi:hypothetical protein
LHNTKVIQEVFILGIEVDIVQVDSLEVQSSVSSSLGGNPKSWRVKRVVGE